MVQRIARALLVLMLLGLVQPAAAQQSSVRIVGLSSDGTDRNILATTDGRLQVDTTPSANSASGVAPVATSAAASNLVAKGSAGNLYRATASTAASAGYLMVFNATTAPADGAVTPLMCRQVAANSTVNIDLSAVPAYFSTGITLVFSTTGCFTKTASTTAFLEASAK